MTNDLLKIQELSLLHIFKLIPKKHLHMLRQILSISHLWIILSFPRQSFSEILPLGIHKVLVYSKSKFLNVLNSNQAGFLSCDNHKEIRLTTVLRRSSHRKCSVKIGVLRNFAKKTPVPDTLLEQVFYLAQVFSCGFCEIFKNTFLNGTRLDGCFWIRLVFHHLNEHKFKHNF